MVAFQEDNDPRSTGNGSFDTTQTTKRLIDPPPHDQSYAAEHLEFLGNYFRRASHGKLVITGDVLPSVYRLPYQMPHYSPPRGSTVNTELGRLMQDGWHAVDSATPGIAFSNYQIFLLLHAGSGRDVDLTSLYGFDPTPFDIPSIYLNLASLRKMFGNSYQGVPVDGGAYNITNTIILPETESRDISTSLGTSRLQLGINGLLAASVGSHLGLPDLFDTKTGATGIGRFGLMDGQSIFSWSGLFPPLPSAWERYFLGWINPVVPAPGSAVYGLPAAGWGSQEDSVYRLPISAKEYFLVENRNRDANRDGSIVTLVRNGQTVTRSWAHDTTGFNDFDIDSLYGVLTDIDEPDWSLPGGVSSGTHEFYDGGILIWHVDETVIDANYAADAVNADPERRGVNLEEADGSQDIGQTYGLISSGNGSENGTVLDFWYAGNRAPVRLGSNEFTPSSQPSSESYDHANSHIYVSGFSSRAPRMTATIQIGDAQVTPIAGFPHETVLGFGRNSLTVIPASGGFPSVILGATIGTGPVPPPTAGNPTPGPASGPSRLYGWTTDGSPILPGGSPSGLLATPAIPPAQLNGKPGVGDFDVDGTPDVTLGGVWPFGPGGAHVPTGLPTEPRTFFGWSLKDANGDHLIDTLFLESFVNTITTSPVVTDSFIAYGTQKGMVYLLGYDGSVAQTLRVSPFDSSDIVSLSLFQNPASFVAVTANGSLGLPGVACAQLSSALAAEPTPFHPSYAIAATLSADLGKRLVLVTRDGTITLSSACGPFGQKGFSVSTGGEILNAPAVADIDGDGVKDIIVCSGNRIYAINAIGSVLDHFPVTLPTDKTILTSPIVADLDGDRSPDVIAVTQEGLVAAYDRYGRMLRGFPLLAGPNGGSTPAQFYMTSDCLSCADIGLAVASDDGHIYAWKTGTLATGIAPPPPQPWPQFMHDAANTGLSDTLLPKGPAQSGFFPPSRAYNWPNPVDRAHGYTTHIRYFVGTAASVHIRILDLAGDKVTEFDAPGVGGLDNEVEWNVSGIQSGIYFAHIDAQGAGGSGSAVIKIAVVK